MPSLWHLVDKFSKAQLVQVRGSGEVADAVHQWAAQYSMLNQSQHNMGIFYCIFILRWGGENQEHWGIYMLMFIGFHCCDTELSASTV